MYLLPSVFFLYVSPAPPPAPRPLITYARIGLHAHKHTNARTHMHTLFSLINLVDYLDLLPFSFLFFVLFNFHRSFRVISIGLSVHLSYLCGLLVFVSIYLSTYSSTWSYDCLIIYLSQYLSNHPVTRLTIHLLVYDHLSSLLSPTGLCFFNLATYLYSQAFLHPGYVSFRSFLLRRESSIIST